MWRQQAYFLSPDVKTGAASGLSSQMGRIRSKASFILSPASLAWTEGAPPWPRIKPQAPGAPSLSSEPSCSFPCCGRYLPLSALRPPPTFMVEFSCHSPGVLPVILSFHALCYMVFQVGRDPFRAGNPLPYLWVPSLWPRGRCFSQERGCILLRAGAWSPHSGPKEEAPTSLELWFISSLFLK